MKVEEGEGGGGARRGGGLKEHAYMVIGLGGEEAGTVVLKGRELEEFDEDEVPHESTMIEST